MTIKLHRVSFWPPHDPDTETKKLAKGHAKAKSDHVRLVIDHYHAEARGLPTDSSILGWQVFASRIAPDDADTDSELEHVYEGEVVGHSITIGMKGRQLILRCEPDGLPADD